MSDINAPIPYRWTLGWEEMSTDAPKVNRLLKAALEGNVAQMEYLFKHGASLKATDQSTFQRVLFHVMDDYAVMDSFVRHGLSRIAYDIDADGDNGINEKKCISPYGFFWGLTARAYYLKAYDVMALLAANGFDEFACYDKGWNDTWYADKHIWRTGDLKALRILLENGYVYDLASEKYILGRPQVRRKTIGLDPAKFHKSISPPKYEDEPLFFGRKEAKARNARRREDYEDRVRAHKEFQNSFGIDNLRELRTRWKSAKKEYDDLLTSVSISEKDISRIIFEMGAE